AAGTAATGTGSFTAQGFSGTVSVNGQTFSASTGTAASQKTTITGATDSTWANKTITITNGSTSKTFTASAPTPEIDTISYTGQNLPDDTATRTLAGIVYQFKASSWSSVPT